ncbi:MAG: c-type cytochrome [Pirellulales bacterium]
MILQTVKHNRLLLRVPGFLFCIALFVLSGCSKPAEYSLNLVAVHKAELALEASFVTEHQLQPIAEVLEAMFGTPDNPFVPPAPGIEEVLDIDKIRMAAGPYGTDELGNAQGLYRQHCVHCHGTNGDGAGPTAAILNPYPRDYRMGKFKFKSTSSGSKPTHGDLKKTIENGMTGTAMPSFKLLDSDEVEALTHYVKYLSIRGEVENLLISDEEQFAGLYTAVVKPWSQQTEDEAKEVDEMSDEELKEEIETLKETVVYLKSQENLVENVMGFVLRKWAIAEGNVLEIKPKQLEMSLEESIAKGRELFFSANAACSSCHGDTALGDGKTSDVFYDDWTILPTGFYNPEKPEDLPGFLALGALEPRQLRPRNLRLGVYRGGRRPIDIFWRIRNGIDGSQMPAAKEVALSDEEVWNLVDFVRYGLPYDQLSRPQVHKPENKRVTN